ncbi:MAG: hypothetical protein JKX76_01485 [Colwellia sp.]|nr:hypothetical protein [Colwellia sp.]
MNILTFGKHILPHNNTIDKIFNGSNDFKLFKKQQKQLHFNTKSLNIYYNAVFCKIDTGCLSKNQNFEVDNNSSGMYTSRSCKTNKKILINSTYLNSSLFSSVSTIIKSHSYFLISDNDSNPNEFTPREEVYRLITKRFVISDIILLINDLETYICRNDLLPVTPSEETRLVSDIESNIRSETRLVSDDESQRNIVLFSSDNVLKVQNLTKKSVYQHSCSEIYYEITCNFKCNEFITPNEHIKIETNCSNMSLTRPYNKMSPILGRLSNLLKRKQICFINRVDTFSFEIQIKYRNELSLEDHLNGRMKDNAHGIITVEIDKTCGVVQIFRCTSSDEMMNIINLMNDEEVWV